MGLVPKRKTERAPAVDKLLKPAVGVALAMLAYFVIQGFQAELPRVDLSDELALREVLFGEGHGKNYAVLCYNDQDEQNQIPISSVFLDAKSEGSAPAEFVLMDCTNFKLPDSGKTISERFNINMKLRPTIFVSGKYIGGKPKQIPQKHLKTGQMLNKALKSVLEPKTVKITNTKELKKNCLDREMCALFLKGDSNANNNKKIKEVIQSLIVSYPKITFASMDASTLLLTNLEEHVPLPNKGQHQFLMFEKVSGSFAVPTSDDTKNKKDDEEEDEEETKNKKTTDNSTKKSSGRLISSISTYKGYNMDYNSLSTYLDSVVSTKKDKPIKLSTLPQIKTRTKKLEKQYEEKRQRYQDRKAKKQNTASSSSSNTFSSSSSSSGMFEEGSKEARKAERDRRRAEHLKAQGARERTPEEIAERERQRRKRMEEEAAKWNMVPEDAPEEGEYVGEEEPLESMFEEEDGETSSTYVEEEDDESIEDLDDEDVLDLD